MDFPAEAAAGVAYPEEFPRHDGGDEYLLGAVYPLPVQYGVHHRGGHGRPHHPGLALRLSACQKEIPGQIRDFQYDCAGADVQRHRHGHSQLYPHGQAALDRQLSGPDCPGVCLTDGALSDEAVYGADSGLPAGGGAHRRGLRLENLLADCDAERQIGVADPDAAVGAVSVEYGSQQLHL